MVNMGNVWDRTTEFLSDNLARDGADRAAVALFCSRSPIGALIAGAGPAVQADGGRRPGNSACMLIAPMGAIGGRRAGARSGPWARAGAATTATASLGARGRGHAGAVRRSHRCWRCRSSPCCSPMASTCKQPERWRIGARQSVGRGRRLRLALCDRALRWWRCSSWFCTAMLYPVIVAEGIDDRQLSVAHSRSAGASCGS